MAALQISSRFPFVIPAGAIWNTQRFRPPSCMCNARERLLRTPVDRLQVLPGRFSVHSQTDANDPFQDHLRYMRVTCKKMSAEVSLTASPFDASVEPIPRSQAKQTLFPKPCAKELPVFKTSLDSSPHARPPRG